MRTNVPDNKSQDETRRGLLKISKNYFTILSRAKLGVKAWGKRPRKAGYFVTCCLW